MMNTSTPSDCKMRRVNVCVSPMRLLLLLAALSFARFGTAQLTVTAPPDASIECDESSHPDDLGYASATGGCEPWINEFHYDDAGTDTLEFIEIAGPAGFDLTGWSLVLYNGTGGAVYDTDVLSGVIDNEAGGYGALAFFYPVNGIQNGAPDGIALVDAGGMVQQFISYEGTFTAVGGAANGMLSVDVGVSENGSQIGMSLQLSASYVWSGPATASAGSLNTNQSLSNTPGINVTLQDQFTFQNCVYEGTIARTWTATDQCGNTDSAVQTITVTDDTPPTMSCPATITINPGDPTDPMVTGIPSLLNDNCDNSLGATFEDVPETNCPAAPDRIIRTWILSDECGNVTTCVQSIWITCDLVVNGACCLPDGSCVETSTGECALQGGTYQGDGTLCAQTICPLPCEIACPSDPPIIEWPFGFNLQPVGPNVPQDPSVDPDIYGFPEISEGCTDPLAVIIFQDQLIMLGNCPDSVWRLDRIWTLINDGVTYQCVQRFYFSDTTDPNVDCVAFTFNVEWGDPIPELPPFVTDNCGTPDVTYSDSEFFTGQCPLALIITRTWYATDNCDNVSSCTQIINVTDTTPPSITCPDDVTVQQGDPTDPQSTGFATATDNCGIPTVTYVDFLDFDNCPFETDKINRHWYATDVCGYVTTCIQFIWIPCCDPCPVICPDNEVVECDGQGNEGDFSVWIDGFTNQDCDNLDASLTTETIEGTLLGGQTIVYSDFSDVSAFTLNGRTGTVGNPVSYGGTDVLRLVDALPTQGGSAFLTNAVQLGADGSFSTYFTFQISNPGAGGADGLTFCLQPTSNAELGDIGGGIGYLGLSPSLVVEFDSWDNGGVDDFSGNHVGIALNGDIDAVAQTDVAPAFDDGDIWSAWVDYNGATDVLEVRAVVGNGVSRPAAPNLSYVIDVPALLGTTDLFIGFTSATGGAYADHDIRSWGFNDHYEPIESCGTRIIARYVAVDACGNVTTCTRTFDIFDTTAPEMQCTKPAPYVCMDHLITSSDLIAQGYAAAFDICDPEPFVTVIDSAMVASGCTQTWTYTFKAIDDCGNESEPCAIIVSSYYDETPPEIFCTNPPHLGCNPLAIPTPQQILNAGYVVATDDCGTPTIGLIPPITNTNDGCTYTRTYRFRATDLCGHQSPICTVVLTWTEDTQPPTMQCPETIALQCPSDPIPAPSPTTVIVTDNCSLEYVTWIGDVSDGLTCPTTITRTYEAADTCGNVSICTQYIVIDDTTPPTITCPDLLVLECGMFEEIPVTTAIVDDNCTEDPFVTYIDAEYPQDCANQVFIDGYDQVITLIVRTFYVTDDCDNTSSCTQHILVRDDLPPSLTCPPDVTIECTDDPDNLALTGEAIVHDLCDPDAFATILIDQPIFTSPCSTVIIRYWTATDFCGNGDSGTICPQTITILDTTAPDITCPNDATIECGDPLPAVEFYNGHAYVLSSSVGSWEDARAEALSMGGDLVAINNAAENAFLAATFGGAGWTWMGYNDIATEATFVWSNGDPSGYENWAGGEPNDCCGGEDRGVFNWNANGDWNDCEESLCGSLQGIIEIPIATDNCQEVNLTYVDSDPVGTCPMVVTRTYYANDGCGNESSCEQLIYIEDTTAPTLVCPGDFSVECGDPIPVVCPFVSDICSEDEIIDVVTGTLLQEDPLMDAAFFSFAGCIDDWICGDRRYDTYSFTITTAGMYVFTGVFDPLGQFGGTDGMGGVFAGSFDPDNPCDNFVAGSDDDNLGSILDPKIIVCELMPGDYTLVSTEWCGVNDMTYEWTIGLSPIVVTHVDSDTTGDCPQYITRTFYAEDECGNISSCTSTIVIIDTTPPEIVCPDDVTLECAVDTLPTDLATATDICNDVLDITYSDEYFPQDCDNNVFIDGENQVLAIIVRTHYATDACGNVATCTQHILIRDDTPPMVTCPDDVTIECDEDPNNLELTGMPIVHDLCDPDAYAFIIATVPLYESPCSTVLQRVWQATDDCGNGDSGGICVQQITILDTEAPEIFCPENLYLECGDDLPVTSAQAIDNCNEVSLTYTDHICSNSGFTGDYAFENWTATEPNGGDVQTSGDEQVTLVSPEGANCFPGLSTLFSIVVSQSGTIVFSWNYQTFDSFGDPVWDPFGYNLNGTFYQLTQNGGPIVQSGVATVEVSAGDVFAFEQNSLDCIFGAGATTVIDFFGCTNDEPQVLGDTCLQVVIRTHYAEDICGNVSSCVQLIYFEDTTPPVISCPATVTVECGEELPTTLATATDLCDDDLEITYSDNMLLDQGDCAWITLRTHYAVDDCGNVATCYQLLLTIDTTPPTITCPDDVTIECGTPLPDSEAIASDICSDVTVSYTDLYIPSGTWSGIIDVNQGFFSYSLEVTFYADCSATAVYAGQPCNPPVTWTLQSVNGNVFTYLESDLCGIDGCTIINIYSGPTLDIAIDCGPNYLGLGTLTTEGICEQYVKRTFYAEDECGLVSSCVQTITIVDTTPPDLTCPEDYTVTCEEQTCLTFDDVFVPPIGPLVDASTIVAGGVTIDVSARAKFGIPVVPVFVDTEVPGPDDDDLRTPNVLFGGPGINSDDPNGFEPSNNEPRGVAIIIQTPGFIYPDDYSLSDSLIFDFSDPVFLTSLVAVDIEEPQALSGAGASMFDEDGMLLGFVPFTGGADNNVEEVYLLQPGVSRLVIYYGLELTTSGGIADLCFVYVPCETEAAIVSDLCNDVNVVCNDETNVIDECITEITQTYSASDACDNVSESCTRVITLETDTEQPEIQCPADLTLDCGALLPPPNPSTVIATDNCSEVIIVTWVADIPTAEGDCESVIRRIYRATDECGNSAMCAQFIYFIDQTPPVIICPEAITIECGEDLPVTSATATDDCNEFTLTYIDGEPVGDCPMVVTRTHYAADICGNVSSCTQYIYIEDTTPPSITCPFDLNVECGDPIPMICPTAIDICGSSELIATVSGNLANGDPVMSGAFFNGGCVEEWCERYYDTYSFTIVVPGTYVFTGIFGPEAFTTESDGMGGVFAGTFDPGNPCANFVAGSDDDSPNSILDPQIFTCVLEAGDYTLVSTSFWCSNDEMDYTWTIELLDVTLTSVDSEPTGECPMVIVRTHYATDDCGNVSSCTQRIYIHDTTPPSITCPDDLTLECAVDEIPTTLATATDICDDLVDVTYVDVEYEQDCENGVFVDGVDQVLTLIVRTHYATDNCGNVSTCTQHIIIRDDTPPMVTCPDNVTIECDQDPNDLQLTGVPIVTDLCDPEAYATIVITFPLYTSPCSTVLQRVWIATDHCGNGDSGGLCAQTITILDTTPPELTTCPNNMTIECGDAIPDGLVLYGGSAYMMTNVSGTWEEARNEALSIGGDLVAINSAAENAFLFGAFGPNLWMGYNDVAVEGSFVWSNGDPNGYENWSPGEPNNAFPEENYGVMNWGGGDQWNDFGPERPDYPVGGLRGLIEFAFATDNCQEVVYTYSDSEPVGTCPMVITRTHYVSDGCDNVTTCVQLIYIEDTTAPEISCADDVTIECGDDLPEASWTVSDICDDAPVVTYVDHLCNFHTVGFTGDFDFANWTATEVNGGSVTTSGSTQVALVGPNGTACGGLSTLFSVVIPASGELVFVWNYHTEDVDGPGFDPFGYNINGTFFQLTNNGGSDSQGGVAVVTVSAGDVFAFEQYSSDCILGEGATTVVDFYGCTGETGYSCDQVVIRTVIATDECGNSSACGQGIYIEDTTPPAIVCPPDLTLECDLPIPDVLATATDICDPEVTITYSDEMIPQECSAEVFVDGEFKVLYLIIRTHYASDDCDNVSSCTQHIIIRDDTPPQVECPPNVTVECGDPTDPEFTGWPVVTDNCDPNPQPVYVDLESGECPVTILRVWSATDWCGNGLSSNICVQVITIEDTTPPSITCPFPIAVECGDPIPMICPLAVDVCSANELIATVSGSLDDADPTMEAAFFNSGCVYPWALGERYYETYSFSVTEPGVYVFTGTFGPEEGFTEEDDGMGAVFAGTFDPNNPCDNFVAGSDDDNPGSFWDPRIITCQLEPGSYTLVSTSYWGSNPAMDYSWTIEYADIQLSSVDSAPEGECPMIVTRTHYAEDECGNVSSCTQYIYIYDTTPPSITCPDDLTLECNVDEIPTTLATATDICDDAVDVTYVDVEYPQDCANDVFIDGVDQVLTIIVRTHYATDNCGNVSTCTQHIIIRDDTPPTVTCPADITIECDQDPNNLELTGVPIVDDLCDPDAYATIVITFPIYTSPCSTVLQRVWLATDFCGNGNSGGLCPQLITIIDTTPPDLACPDDVTIECGDELPAVVFYNGNGYLLSSEFGSWEDARAEALSFGGDLAAINDAAENAFLLAEFGSAGWTWMGYNDIASEATWVWSNDDPSGYENWSGGEPNDCCGGEDRGVFNWDSFGAWNDCEEALCGSLRGIIEIPLATDNCQEVTLTYVDSDPVGTCPMVVTRTYYANDGCDNESICTQYIYIEDTTAPEMTCPDEITVECVDDVPAFDGTLVSATDLCDEEVTITFGGDELITGVLYGSDLAGNYFSINHLTGAATPINVFGGLPPVTSIEYNAVDKRAHLQTATGTDLGHEFDAQTGALVGGLIPNNPPSGTGLRSLQGMEWVGSTLYVAYTELGGGFVPSTFASLDPNTGLITNISPVGGAAPYPLNGLAYDAGTATMYASGGPSGDLLTVNLITGATTLVGNMGVVVGAIEFGPDGMLYGGGGQGNSGFLYRINPGNGVATVVGPTGLGTTMTGLMLVGSGGCVDVVKRTYIAMDDCGNTATCTQHIVILDTTPPEIVCPADLTLECHLDIPVTLATATDNCDADVDLTYSDEVIPQECSQDVFVDGERKVLYLVVRTHYAIDDCGNISTCTQHIVLRDDTPPVVVCPPAVTVECGDPTDPEFTGWPEVTDNCDPNPQPIYVDLAPSGNSCVSTFIRVWTATDHCGNGMSSNICLQFITIVDTTPPSITCPDDVTIECGDPLPTTLATGTDACNSVAFTYTDSAPAGECPMVITRTHYATDVCGNFSTCTQYITIEDTTPPAIDCPDDVTLECNVDPIPTTLATATDICDDAVDVTYVDVEYPQDCANDVLVDGVDQVKTLIVRTHYATDDCGNVSTCTQHIVIRDDTPPSITCPADLTIECDQDPNDLQLTGVPVISDLCDPDAYATIVVTFPIYMDPCSTVLQRVWLATDMCGNGDSGGLCTQYITIVDTTPPAITCPADVTIECGDDIPMVCPQTSDNCTENELVTTLTGSLSAGDPVMDGGFYSSGCIDQGCDRYYDTYTFTVTEGGVYTFTGVFGPELNFDPADDGMGGVFAGTFDPNNPCENYVAGSDDDRPSSFWDPLIITCLLGPGEYTLVSTSFWCENAEMDYAWTIERSDIALTHVDSAPVGECPMVITRTHYAMDECGNVSSCVQLIYVEDTTPPSITCPPTVTIECGEDLPTTLATATDVCDTDLDITYTDLPGEDQGQCAWTILRTHYATDNCGNVASCVQLILIIDTTPPVISCPADATVECGDEVGGAGIATATDACDTDPFVTIINEQFTEGSCVYTIIRTYQAWDACGNSSICTQVITVEDTTAPEVTCPDDQAYSCNELTCLTFDEYEVDGQGLPIVLNQIIQGGVTVDITAWSKGGNQRDPVLFNTFDPHNNDLDLGTPNVLYGGPGVNSDDPDGYEISNNRPLGNILIVQTPGTMVPDDYFISDSIVLNFSEPVFMESLVAMDFEADQIATGAGIYLYDGDGALISFTGLLGDGMDNSMEEVSLKTAGVSKLVMYYGAAIPGSGGIGGLCYVYVPCETQGVLTYDACNESNVFCSDTTIVIDECTTEIVRTYTAEDACGNVNEVGCTQTITLNTDNQQPDIICPADITIGCEDEVPAPDPGSVAATDNCTDAANITIAWVGDFSEGLACAEVIRRVYSATDECGNVALCVQFITRDGIPEQIIFMGQVFLQAAMTPDTNMDARLNDMGYLPDDQPYTMEPFDYWGAEHCDELHPDIVDWVLVQLRDVVTMEVVAQKAGLVKESGMIVAEDCVSPITFTATGGYYYLTILHRNHLGIVTDIPMDCSEGWVMCDFTEEHGPMEGMVEVVDGVFAMTRGDVNGDNLVKYNGSNNDKNAVLSAVGILTPNNVVPGYNRYDVNMDGVVKYNGSNNDKNAILSVVGLLTPNNIVVGPLYE